MDNPLIELQARVLQTSQVEVARQLGVSPQYLHDVLNQRRQVGKKILEALGLEKLVTYRKINGRKAKGNGNGA